METTNRNRESIVNTLRYQTVSSNQLQAYFARVNRIYEKFQVGKEFKSLTIVEICLQRERTEVMWGKFILMQARQFESALC